MMGTSYSPFKADVYSLGRTAVAAASLDLPEESWPIAGLDEKARQVVQALDYSPELQQLLISMLSFEEKQRPSMQQVHDALKMTGNYICALCKYCEADSYCTCVAPPTYLCKECALGHFTKFPFAPHNLLNARSSPYVEIRTRVATTQTSPEAKEEDSKQTQAKVLSEYKVGPSIYSNSQTALSIYEGKRIATNESVIIKTYESPDLVKVNEQLKEGVIQARFEHPNVCRLIDIRVSSENSSYRIHLIVEKLDRNLLEDIQVRAKARRPVSEAELVTFLRQIGSALKCGQRKGLAHRDIKPENILIDSGGHYKLCDFGGAWQRLALTLTNSPQGTLPYMCKQARLSLISEENRYEPFKADIYALGITTLYLAALAPPFRPRETGHGFVSVANETLGSLRLSEGFKRLLRAMLAEEEAPRADIDAVLSAIGA